MMLAAAHTLSGRWRSNWSRLLQLLVASAHDLSADECCLKLCHLGSHSCSLDLPVHHRHLDKWWDLIFIVWSRGRQPTSLAHAQANCNRFQVNAACVGCSATVWWWAQRVDVYLCMCDFQLLDVAARARHCMCDVYAFETIIMMTLATNALGACVWGFIYIDFVLIILIILCNFSGYIFILI